MMEMKREGRGKGRVRGLRKRDGGERGWGRERAIEGRQDRVCKILNRMMERQEEGMEGWGVTHAQSLQSVRVPWTVF